MKKPITLDNLKKKEEKLFDLRIRYRQRKNPKYMLYEKNPTAGDVDIIATEDKRSLQLMIEIIESYVKRTKMMSIQDRMIEKMESESIIKTLN